MSNISRKYHPGSYVKEVFEDFQMTQHEFAMRLDMDDKQLSLLMNEKRRLTMEDAMKIATLLGTSTDVWINLQNSYDQYLLELKKEETFVKEKNIYRMIDKHFLAQTHLVDFNLDLASQIDCLKRNLFLTNLETLKTEDFFTFFRKSKGIESEKTIILQNVWIATALKKASIIKKYSFNESELKQLLHQILPMTLMSPKEFIPKLQELMCLAGVQLVVLPYLPQSNIYGITRWVDNHVVVAVSTRGKYSDIFWFSFFHELDHVFKKAKREMLMTHQKMEIEADHFSSDFLIPKEDYEQLIKEKINEDSILSFSKKIGIDPGIIVGRLQHDHIVSFSQFNQLRTKYEFDF